MEVRSDSRVYKSVLDHPALVVTLLSSLLLLLNPPIQRSHRPAIESPSGQEECPAEAWLTSNDGCVPDARPTREIVSTLTLERPSRNAIVRVDSSSVSDDVPLVRLLSRMKLISPDGSDLDSF